MNLKNTWHKASTKKTMAFYIQYLLFTASINTIILLKLKYYANQISSINTLACSKNISL